MENINLSNWDATQFFEELLAKNKLAKANNYPSSG